jgi:hypothetical protein
MGTKKDEPVPVDEYESAIQEFAELLRPYALPPTPAHVVLQQAAKLAGWIPPSERPRSVQQIAARGRARQRQRGQALRRVLVSYLFKTLPRRLRAKPSSTATAQAILGRLESLNLERLPTLRTIQEDIRDMRQNGNFGL